MSDPTPKRRIPFWLTLSIMANLLLLGLVVGSVLRSPHHRLGPDGMAPQRPPILGEASHGDRKVVRRIMMEAFQSADTEVAERRTARATLGEALQIDPYDPEAVRRAFAALRRSDEAVHSTIHESLVDRLGELSVEQRRALAEMLSREPGDEPRRRRDRPGDDDDGPRGPRDRD
ncbi:periplasmic heavy metal sensor [Hyphomonas sp.]|uniref:periplasmic heavy metal sensor n=1 Tax=Hyphomonas sp. TaxID=87 RepID=UPI0030F5B2D2